MEFFEGEKTKKVKLNITLNFELENELNTELLTNILSGDHFKFNVNDLVANFTNNVFQDMGLHNRVANNREIDPEIRVLDFENEPEELQTEDLGIILPN